jgi:hypothetical protein
MGASCTARLPSRPSSVLLEDLTLPQDVVGQDESIFGYERPAQKLLVVGDVPLLVSVYEDEVKRGCAGRERLNRLERIAHHQVDA